MPCNLGTGQLGEFVLRQTRGKNMGKKHSVVHLIQIFGAVAQSRTEASEAIWQSNPA